MPDTPTQAVSIDPETLVDAYERARRQSESGDRAWRITTGQRIDLHRLVTDLRGPGGLAERGAEPHVWIDYLAPILAESGPARNLLQEVLLSFATETKPPPPPPPPPPSPLWRRLLPQSSQTLARLTKASWRIVVGSIAVVALIVVAFVALSQFGTRGLQSPTIVQPIKNPDPDANKPRQSPAHVSDWDAEAANAYHEAMAVTRQLLNERRNDAVTPRLLAAAHAASNPGLGSTDTLLVNMLRGWPISPDEPLTADDHGIASLKRLTAEIAAISTGLPRVLFEASIAPGEKDLVPDLLGGKSFLERLNLVPQPWSKAWLSLSGIPLLLFVLYAALGFRRRTNKLRERWIAEEVRFVGGPPALEGIRQSSGAINVRVPDPLITRQSLRALMRYRPVPGRHLDARRSVREVVRNAGYAEPVMRPVQQIVDYLVIVQRWQPHDHERFRVRQFMEAMIDRGLDMTVYDYDRDPLLVRRVAAANQRENMGGLNGREELFALPALRDLHPDARLILVTDGRDIVDRITGRVRESVVKGFSFWQERALLTPVPVGDWGEIEFALSRDLNLPLGRTTEDMAADLVHGFDRATGGVRYRAALDRARGVIGLAKLDHWWDAVAAGFGDGAKAAFGDRLLPEKSLLVTDLEPPPEVVAKIVGDLRRWLGAKGFLWHAGCAIYPQLRFDLTLYIGMNVRVGPHPQAPFVFRGTPADRRILERITILPWFRTGHMPEWLRREVLAAISIDELGRASEVVRSLFDPGRQETAGPLAIWWPRAGALTIPPDAVMASALAGNIRLEAPPVTAEREMVLAAAARRAVLRSQFETAFLIGCACVGAGWLVPDFGKSPHPAGAWYPLFAFVLICLTTVIFCIGLRRLFPFAPKPPRTSLSDSTAPAHRLGQDEAALSRPRAEAASHAGTAAPEGPARVTDPPRPPLISAVAWFGAMIIAGLLIFAFTEPAQQTWNQVYNPLGNAVLSTVAAAIPVVTLLVLIASGKVKAHIAAIVAAILTNLIAIFIFSMPTSMSIRASLLGIVVGFFPIGWVLLNIIFLYRLTVQTGQFELLKCAVAAVTEDRRLQLLLIAFSFGAFFEGASGFGTPIAVTGAVLIGLGFSPLAASGLSLIANTVPVAYGALGTPIQGLAAVTGLDPYILGAMVGRQLPVFSLIVPFWIVWAFAGWKGMKEVWPAILVTGVSFAAPQFVISNYINPWIVNIGASLTSMSALILFLKVWQPKQLWLSPKLLGRDESAETMGTAKQLEKRPLTQGQLFSALLPWIIVCIVMLIWGNGAFKIWANSIFTWNFQVPGLHQMINKMPPVTASPTKEGGAFAFTYLSFTGSGMLIAAIICGLLMGLGPVKLIGEYGRTIKLCAVPLITISAMLAIGTLTRASGIDATLGLAFIATGVLYPFFGTLLGWLGVVLTGSDTTSNILFGNLQKITSEQLGLSPVLMAAANSSGGVMGKMIDAQTIVVASTATNWYGHEGSILRFVFKHSIALACLVGFFVMLQVYLYPFTAMVLK